MRVSDAPRRDDGAHDFPAPLPDSARIRSRSAMEQHTPHQHPEHAEPPHGVAQSTAAEQTSPAQEPAPKKRQFTRFAFFKVAPEWRRLPAEEREQQKREFAD